MDHDFVVRTGDESDEPLLLDLFDASINWMVSRGQTEQWGSTPFSEIPARVAAVQKWASAGGLYICERDGRPAAAMVLGDAQPYVSPAVEPEVYVVVLVGSHEPFARGAGAHLLSVADDVARARNIPLLRVDCFAGNDGALVRYYERCGYTRTETFQVESWPGQVLERRIDVLAARRV